MPEALYMLDVVGLKVTIPGLMEVNHDGHYLTLRQFARSFSLPLALDKLLLSPGGFEVLPEIIDSAKEFDQDGRWLDERSDPFGWSFSIERASA